MPKVHGNCVIVGINCKHRVEAAIAGIRRWRQNRKSMHYFSEGLCLRHTLVGDFLVLCIPLINLFTPILGDGLSTKKSCYNKNQSKLSQEATPVTQPHCHNEVVHCHNEVGHSASCDRSRCYQKTLSGTGRLKIHTTTVPMGNAKAQHIDQ